ncbi:MAG: TolB family protein, partial [Paludibacteraceae bacterium]
MKTTVKIMCMAIALSATFTSCNKTDKSEKDSDEIIGKQTVKLENGLMTPETLWAFGRIGNVQVSPEEDKILYSVSYYSVKQNRSNSELFVMNIDGTDKKQITKTPLKETAAKWIEGGDIIAFISNESGSMQVWGMNPDGSGRRQIT